MQPFFWDWRWLWVAAGEAWGRREAEAAALHRLPIP
jgi:hypothetical protein